MTLVVTRVIASVALLYAANTRLLTAPDRPTRRVLPSPDGFVNGPKYICIEARVARHDCDDV
jgi:hypothetical protein